MQVKTMLLRPGLGEGGWVSGSDLLWGAVEGWVFYRHRVSLSYSGQMLGVDSWDMQIKQDPKVCGYVFY